MKTSAAQKSKQVKDSRFHKEEINGSVCHTWRDRQGFNLHSNASGRRQPEAFAQRMFDEDKIENAQQIAPAGRRTR